MNMIKRRMDDEAAIEFKVAGDGFDELRRVGDMLEDIKTYNYVI